MAYLLGVIAVLCVVWPRDPLLVITFGLLAAVGSPLFALAASLIKRRIKKCRSIGFAVLFAIIIPPVSLFLFGDALGIGFGEKYQAYKAGFIEYQCKVTQEQFIEPTAQDTVPNDSHVEGLAMRLAFLMCVYDGDIKSVGPRLEPEVTREYQQTLKNAVALMRKQAKVDLGDDPKAWTKKYANYP